MKFNLFLLLFTLFITSCSEPEVSSVSIGDVIYENPEVEVNFVEYCYGGYLYEVLVSQDDMSFKIMTDDVDRMTWIAIFNFSSGVSCGQGMVAPYDNKIEGSIQRNGDYVDIIGTVGLECLNSEGGWSPIDADIAIEIYGAEINY